MDRVAAILEAIAGPAVKRGASFLTELPRLGVVLDYAI